jgi:hypothetical protein
LLETHNAVCRLEDSIGIQADRIEADGDRRFGNFRVAGRRLAPWTFPLVSNFMRQVSGPLKRKPNGAKNNSLHLRTCVAR